MLRLALFEPEIPQNTGTLMRLGACLDIPIDVIEPCGFIYDDKRLKRSGMDYRDIVNVTRHADIHAFWTATTTNRVILLDVKAELSFYDFAFEAGDIVMVGRESNGLPEAVFNQCYTALKIPMNPNCRSLNVAVAAAMVLTEAIRQVRR